MYVLEFYLNFVVFKKKELTVNYTASSFVVQDMGEELGFDPNPFPQKGGEKVLSAVYKNKIKRILIVY